MEYKSLAASLSELRNGASSGGSDTPSPSEVGKKVGAGWVIITGVLFLVLRG